MGNDRFVYLTFDIRSNTFVLIKGVEISLLSPEYTVPKLTFLVGEKKEFQISF